MDVATLHWRHRRAVARVGEIVDEVVADFATTCWGRPFRRREVLPLSSAIELPGVVWSIEGETIVELLTTTEEQGPSRLVVHELSLLALLRKRVRSRHVTVEHISAAWGDSVG